MRHWLGSGVPTRDPVVSKGVSSSTISGLLGARAPGVVTFGFLRAPLPLAPSVAQLSLLAFGPPFPLCWLDGGYVTQGVMRHRLGSGVPTRDLVVSKGVSSSTISGLLGARAPGVVTFGFLRAPLPLAPSVARLPSLAFGPPSPPCWRSSCLLRVPPLPPTLTTIHLHSHTHNKSPNH